MSVFPFASSNGLNLGTWNPNIYHLINIYICLESGNESKECLIILQMGDAQVGSLFSRNVLIKENGIRGGGERRT